MQCTTCQYPLWNIAARTCPECGSAFKPSEYRFIANSVRFCCPHCKQDYYGTSPEGHLEPRSFMCVRCQRPIDEDEMVLLPTAGVREEQTRVDEHPWLKRDKAFWKPLWGTVWRSLFSPTTLTKAMPKDKVQLGQAIWYLAILSIGSAAVIGVGTSLLFGLMGMLRTGMPGPGGGFVVPWAMAAPFAGMAVASPIVTMMLVLLWGMVAHVYLLPVKKAGSLGRTLEVFAYGATPIALVSLVSCVGPMAVGFTTPWAIVVTILMLRDRQGVSGGVATAAVLGAGVLGVGAMVGLIVLVASM